MEPIGGLYSYQGLPFKKMLFSPLKAQGLVPEQNAKLHIGSIPQSATIRDLATYFERVGAVYEIELLMTTDVEHRGFGFVTFWRSNSVQIALNSLSAERFMGGPPLKLQLPFENSTVYIRGLPTDKTKDEIWNELRYFYDIQNILDVRTYRKTQNPALYKGYALVKFRTRAEATYFQAKYSDNLVLFGKKVRVSWATTTTTIANENLDQGKILSVRNMKVAESVDEYTRTIHKFIDEQFIEKIFKFRDCAFLHLKTREHAEELLEKLKLFYQGTFVEVCFASPPKEYTPGMPAPPAYDTVFKEPLENIVNVPSTA